MFEQARRHGGRNALERTNEISPSPILQTGLIPLGFRADLSPYSLTQSSPYSENQPTAPRQRHSFRQQRARRLKLVQAQPLEFSRDDGSAEPCTSYFWKLSQDPAQTQGWSFDHSIVERTRFATALLVKGKENFAPPLIDTWHERKAGFARLSGRWINTCPFVASPCLVQSHRITIFGPIATRCGSHWSRSYCCFMEKTEGWRFGVAGSWEGTKSRWRRVTEFFPFSLSSCRVRRKVKERSCYWKWHVHYISTLLRPLALL